MSSVGERHLQLVDPEELKRVAEFREVARRLLRDAGLDVEARQSSLLRLYDRARQEPLAELIARALVEEIAWGIRRDDVEELRTFGDAMEREHRSLRGRGYAACPECRTPLSGPIDWLRWRQIRSGAVAEYDAWEGSVP